MEIREIIGNTTATPNPRPDWAQTDSTKADYIKNKPGIGELASKDKITMGDLNSDVQEYLAGIEASVQKTYIRYSEYADGRNFTSEWTHGQNYIGIAVAEEAPTDKDEYEWSLFASNIKYTETVMLTVDGWSDNLQTVSVPNIGNNSSVFCTPHPESKDVYIDCGIMLESAEVSSLTFSCVNRPSDIVSANVQIIEPLIGVNELPEVNEIHNGKVLKVIGGVWALGDDENDTTDTTEIEETLSSHTRSLESMTEVFNDLNDDFVSLRETHTQTLEEHAGRIDDLESRVSVLEEQSGAGTPDTTTYVQDNFSSGLWHRSDSRLNAFYDCENIKCGSDGSLRSVLASRSWINMSDGAQGMFCSKDHLYIASDGELMMSLSENRVQVLGVVTTETKVFAALGRNVLVLPDFKVYDTVTERLSPKYVRLDLKSASLQNNKTIYCTSYDFTSYFVAGDGIRIAATNSNNGYFTIRSVEKNYLHFDENAFITETFPSTIYVLLEAPEMKGACTAMNRVWGWYGDDNGGSSTLIYASAPENIARWYRYDNDAESSYKVKVLSDVALTACVSFSDRPIFFSNNSMIEVVGDSPANFKLVETSMYGVKHGCGKSLCVVGDKMFYLSDAGVVSCDGTTATVISDALGKQFVSGFAASDGRRYYLNAKDDQGVSALYVYDTVTMAWHVERIMSNVNISYLDFLNGDLYAYGSNNVIYIIGEDTTGNGTSIPTPSSYVEFRNPQGVLLNNITPKQIGMNVECEADSALTLSVNYDNEGWEELAQWQSGSSGFWVVPLSDRACHDISVRVNGTGEYRITSFVMEYKT